MINQNTWQILFYENNFYMFSNFAAFAVEDNGIVWPTSEHLYQATKFMDDESKKNIVNEILNARSAYDSKMIKSKYIDQIRKDWDDIKIEKMENIVRKKNEQHNYIQKKLLETEWKEIIEDSEKDDFWWWGPNKDWRNELGKIWMRIRDK